MEVPNSAKYALLALIVIVCMAIFGVGPVLCALIGLWCVGFFVWLCGPDAFEYTIWDKFFP
jgi:hypothetical protein